ncbi:MAG: glycosyltransferase [Opitutaceae bacterium]
MALRKIAILYTTFPVRSEIFVQREFVAIHEQDVEIEVWSLHGGDPDFAGIPIRRFSKWRLWRLLWQIPREWSARPRLFFEFLHLLLSGDHHPSILNLGENLLGIGFAIVEAPAFRRSAPDLIHGVWGSLPAMGAWMLSRLCDIPFTFEAHAYDLFEHGGDWFLREKVKAARLIRTSTGAGATRLREVGADPGKVILVRRGLLPVPPYPERGPVREPTRLVGVGRLVEKKGFLRQIEILAALRDRGVDFTARLIGDGPQRETLRHAIDRHGLADRVSLTGWMSVEEVALAMVRSDFLLHTGQVARSGDRDGLPNVVGEAMSVGTIVLSTPEDGVAEAVIDGQTGFLCPLADDTAWLAVVCSLLEHPVMAGEIRKRARAWVESEFDARVNIESWFRRLREIGTDSGEGLNAHEGLF